jgi:hypothetical protein
MRPVMTRFQVAALCALRHAQPVGAVQILRRQIDLLPDHPGAGRAGAVDRLVKIARTMLSSTFEPIDFTSSAAP